MWRSARSVFIQRALLLMKVSGPRRAYLIRTIDLFDPPPFPLPENITQECLEGERRAGKAPPLLRFLPPPAMLPYLVPEAPPDRGRLTASRLPAFWNHRALRYNTITFSSICSPELCQCSAGKTTSVAVRVERGPLVTCGFSTFWGFCDRMRRLLQSHSS